MVSPISIPGFPSVHTRQSAATCDTALESRLASLEACVAALPSLITAAIDQAFADSLTQFRRDMFFRGAGEGISTPLAGDHHGSPAIDPIQLTRRPICAEGAQSQLSPSAVQAPPQLSSSLLLQALATSAVKPHSKDSAAATVLLPESKTGIHASTMTSAPRLLHEHSFPDTTKTGSTVLLLFGVIACYTGHSAFVYHAFLNAKYGWVNWYFVGKFVKKDFYALELFEEMSKRLNTYNMSLSSNLDAWDIVEDVAIAYEYNNITMRNQIPKSEPASLKPLTLNEFTELIRLEIAMNGFTEVLTFILGSWQEIFPMSSYKDDKDVAKLKEIGESFIIEGNPESCTSWLSMSGEVLASGDKLMYLPCGLAAGSSITVVGSSHYAYEEYVSQLAKLRWGDGTVMVAQFMDELLTHGGPPYDNIVVLVCRYLPKDLAASFTEENGTLGHINAIKQFLCLSLLHICAFTVMAISQLDYSIFTSLLSKLNQELCHRVDVHLDAVFFPHCVANDQIFQQPGWCHTLTDPCDNISYQRVVFNQRNKFNKRNYAKWSFKVVEENGKRKGFRFDHFDKEDSAMSAASALNDTISKGKDLYVSIFVQKSKNDNRLRIFFNTLNPALSQEVVCYKGLELATNITEACNNRVFGQIVLLLVHSFSDTTMIRLLEEYANLKGLQDGHFRQEGEVFAMLSHKHRNDPLKIREIISMVANSLTSLLNLEIEFKILLQDGTITASILFFLVYGMHFKEQWKSRTTPYVTVPEQHCVSHHVFSYVIGKRWILVELELHHKKTGRRIQMLTFGSEEGMSIIFVFARSLHICLTVSVSWQKELFKFLELDTTQPPYVFKCQLYTLTEVMKDMVEALCLLRSSKSSMHNIGVASDGLKFNDSERIAVFNIQYRLVPSISLFQKMEFYDNQTLGGPSITEKSYEMCFHEGKMTEKDITPMGGFPHCGVVKDGYIRSNEWCVGPKKRIVNLWQSLLNQTARPALEDIKLRTISKAIILGNGPIAIVAALVENLLAGSLGVGPFSPFDAAKYFLATSMEIKMISCVEIYEEATDDKYLVAGTDGVGTKLKLAFDTGIHDTIGIDLVAMSVNDIVTSGAKPLFFLDYYATSRLDVDLAEKVVKGIVDGCQQSDCVLLGGETAEMPGFYADGEYDLSGFAVGVVEKDAVIDGNNIVAGDVLIGLPSSGVHSNGFSLVRRVLAHSGLSLKDQLPGEDITLGEALMAPTVIYVKQVLDIISKGGVKGIAHITGGGFTDNIPRVFPKGLGAVIYNGSWEVPAVFKWIREAGRIEEAEMMRTFNMGVGMVLVVSREAAHRILEDANGANKAYRIGEVVRGEGVSYS